MNYNFTISQISKILDVSKDTLRYYDKIDLFKPQGRTGNNYRHYYLEQFDTLITIKMLRNMGASIEEIKNILESQELDEINILLEKTKQEISSKIDYLMMASERITHFQSEILNFQSDNPCEIVTCPTYYGILGESIMESTNTNLADTIGKSFLELDKSMLQLAYTLSVISRENLMSGNYHTYLHNGLVSTSKISDPILESQRCVKKYVIIGKDEYALMDKYYEEIKTFIIENGFQISGNSYEINLYNQYEKHYIVIYIPIGEQ